GVVGRNIERAGRGEKSRRSRCGVVPRRSVSGASVLGRYQYGICRIPGDAAPLLCGRETVDAGVVLATPTARSEAYTCGDMKPVSVRRCSRRKRTFALIGNAGRLRPMRLLGQDRQQRRFQLKITL